MEICYHVKVCKCSHCLLSRRIDKIVRKGRKSSLIKVIRELQDDLINTQQDLAYKNAILIGEWPSAIEQLEKALAKAKKYRDERTAYLTKCGDESKAAEERGGRSVQQ